MKPTLIHYSYYIYPIIHDSPLQTLPTYSNLPFPFPTNISMEPSRPNSYLRGGDQFEFDEAEVWHATEIINSLPETKKVGFANPRQLRKPSRKIANVDDRESGAKSLPVNIPDWSKILRGEYRERAGESVGGYGDSEEDDDDDDKNCRFPPHEYLARTRVASFSVHEGVGRTLKGRDLRRVRNAIWKQTGFED
ncbi:protein S40-4-like [Primulina tabacum]|uniref:protein S40-4-like n=1 Tax=Primulina tabacum TaxID=48773 RepID=UPI003F5996EE